MADDSQNKNAEQTPAQTAEPPKDKPPKEEPPPGSMVINSGPITGRTAVEGVMFDFNMGARAHVPEGNWRIRFIDPTTSTVTYDQSNLSNVTVASRKRYFIPWSVEIYKDGKPAFHHEYNAKGHRVLLKNISDALGDTIAWIPYAREFKKKHDCEVYYAMNPLVAELLKPNYPDINFVGPDERPPGCYASYYLGCFSPCHDREFQPTSWHTVGLQRNVAYILGVEPKEIRPILKPTKKERLIKEPYVCIGSQASAQPKYWNNPLGWMDLNKFLLEQGYRVLCIDRDRVYGLGYKPNVTPWGAEDVSGSYTLEDRVNMLQYADFFVGLSSGLSWLAWGVGVPVVMISGFSLPEMEFYTPYRVINYNVCTGCFNDDAFDFEHGNFYWCPRHRGDVNREFECTRAISSAQVIETVKRLMAEHRLDPKRKIK